MGKRSLLSVQNCWETYKKDVMSPKAPFVQVSECQLAFYAGSFAILKMLMGLGDSKMSLDDGAAALEVLLQEVEQFVALVGGGSGGQNKPH